MVLRAMGHSNAARKVAIEKQEQFRAAGKVPRMNWPFHWLYGKLTGYGYEPVRLTVVLLMAWIVASLVYWAAVNPARFGSSTHLLTSRRSEEHTSEIQSLMTISYATFSLQNNT